MPVNSWILMMPKHLEISTSQLEHSIPRDWKACSRGMSTWMSPDSCMEAITQLLATSLATLWGRSQSLCSNSKVGNSISLTVYSRVFRMTGAMCLRTQPVLRNWFLNFIKMTLLFWKTIKTSTSEWDRISKGLMMFSCLLGPRAVFLNFWK